MKSRLQGHFGSSDGLGKSPQKLKQRAHTGSAQVGQSPLTHPDPLSDCEFASYGLGVRTRRTESFH